MTASAHPIDLDALDLASVRSGVLRDRPVTVLGLARSGLALARFLADAGARVTVYDGREPGELTNAIAGLEGRPIKLALGAAADPATTWADAVLVATSPSITPDYPTTEPRLRGALQALVAARAGGDPTAPALVSEADLFLRLCPAPTIGVTGTKGKTTTAALTAALLAADPSHPVVLGGNIGIPIIERLPELTPEHRVVDELSELQLPTLSRGTTAAVTPRDRGSPRPTRHARGVSTGQAAPGRPGGRRRPGAQRGGRWSPRTRTRHARASCSTGATGAPGNGGASGSSRGGSSRPASSVLCWRRRPGSDGIRRSDHAGLGLSSRAHTTSRTRSRPSPRHSCSGSATGDRTAAPAFEGVEHRLERVATIDGVRFVNDSQGTQPDAVAAALHAFERPIVLIAGGRAKGLDLDALAPVVADRAVAAVLIGESGPDLEASFRAAGLARTERAADLETAVRRADAIARDVLAESPGGGSSDTATVLLSPAAASFDMFVDYAARGRAFKAAVAALQTERSRGGEA
jgi:UDP-N-acetylmuramoylalanine--D-glutamate ligase